MIKRFVVLGLLAPLFTGCSSIQKVDPVSSQRGEKLCIVENAKVREGFLTAYSNAVKARGMEVLVVPAASGPDVCSLTSTYTASWNWDLALYMRYAQISVYRDGHSAGEAVYDAHTAGMSKFIDADAKVQELVGQLFPVAGQ